jgi:hypothetical protein
MARLRILLKRTVIYFVPALLLAQVMSCVPLAAARLYALVNPVTDAGAPPFRMLNENHKIGIDHRVALRRFPDLNACLFSWGDRPYWGDDPNFDQIAYAFAWNRIRTEGEAEVCVFRALAQLGSPERAVKWIVAQGFNHFSPPKTGTRKPLWRTEQGSWSIRANGRKFSSGALSSAVLPSLAYGMSVTSFWSPDGNDLLAVDVSFSIL